MFRYRSLPNLVLLAVLAAVAGMVTTVSAPAHDATTLVSKKHPTNAGKIFRWGLATWKDEFKQHLSHTWAVNHPKLVRNQVGMLTLDGTAHSGSVTATVRGHAHRHGRWEARVRSQQWSGGHTPYHVVWELVPVGAYDCGARSIVLSDYVPHGHRAYAYLRNRPNVQFSAGLSRNLGDYKFHTYAVEVTRSHISWFVDTRVIMTERRPAALAGARYKIRFRLVAKPGARMNPSRMQMDWVRYYTLARHDARPIHAPSAHRERFAGAC
ncbi:MAG: hypothetical protein QOK15_3803 [Nocardioidaceae bacterium]|jgi:hypothetical protein|nr:hypothetical protein [Nocardioidaceae bacterium]